MTGTPSASAQDPHASIIAEVSFGASRADPVPDPPHPRPHRDPRRSAGAPRILTRTVLSALIWALPNGPSTDWYDAGYALCMLVISRDRDWECELMLPAVGE